MNPYALKINNDAPVEAPRRMRHSYAGREPKSGNCEFCEQFSPDLMIVSGKFPRDQHELCVNCGMKEIERMRPEWAGAAV